MNNEIKKKMFDIQNNKKLTSEEKSLQMNQLLGNKFYNNFRQYLIIMVDALPSQYEDFRILSEGEMAGELTDRFAD